jgi:predicted nucleic acid-binding protein
MNVIDASVFIDALVGVSGHGDRARAEIRDNTVLQVPAIFAAEATSALRAMVLRRELDHARARTALGQLMRVRVIQYPFQPFARRAWELRDNCTVYDAWYVALAERLGLDFVTADRKLLKAKGPRCRVRLPGSRGR